MSHVWEKIWKEWLKNAVYYRYNAGSNFMFSFFDSLKILMCSSDQDLSGMNFELTLQERRFSKALMCDFKWTRANVMYMREKTPIKEGATLPGKSHHYFFETHSNSDKGHESNQTLRRGQERKSVCVCVCVQNVSGTVELKDWAATNKIRQPVKEKRRRFHGNFNKRKLETDKVILWAIRHKGMFTSNTFMAVNLNFGEVIHFIELVWMGITFLTLGKLNILQWAQSRHSFLAVYQFSIDVMNHREGKLKLREQSNWNGWKGKVWNVQFTHINL